jgi:hypothetical protein
MSKNPRAFKRSIDFLLSVRCSLMYRSAAANAALESVNNPNLVTNSVYHTPGTKSITLDRPLISDTLCCTASILQRLSGTESLLSIACTLCAR